VAYTGNPSTNQRDALRLLIWDVSTSTSGEILSNTEVQWFLDVSPNLYSGACLAANVLSARVITLSASTSAVEEKKVGDLMLRFGVSAGNVEGFSRAYGALCAKLEKQSALVGAGPFAGGITISGKRALEQDTDRVKPWARRGQYDNPAAMDPQGGSTRTEDVGQ
jgi:hypothetical protein